MNYSTSELSLPAVQGEDASIVRNGLIERNGDLYYRISDSDRMPPFLMNVVSGSNHWMFIASNGALTAGRRNADNALFPYCTQDKLFELADTVGSFSALWVDGDAEGGVLWAPFKGDVASPGSRRFLYKNVGGDRVVFEEANESLELVLRYSWSSGDRYGFVRNVELVNYGKRSRTIRLLDGIQNLVPYGLDQSFVSQYSNLSDAYKKNELIEDEGLGIYYLSSIPTDRAEPSEGLRATIAWSLGLDRSNVAVSSTQIDAFLRGERLETETDKRSFRCAYLVESNIRLEPGESLSWSVVADINRSASQIEALRCEFSDTKELRRSIEQDLAMNANALRRKIAKSDGLQSSSQPLRDARHYSNTMFNIMRGGIFDDGYQAQISDFLDYLESWNKETLRRHKKSIESLGESIDRSRLLAWAEETGDRFLIRLATEYLPLSFSRRHGDPSRPWNKFSIETQDERGAPSLDYQGNWRDIFQNWEPLAYAYPEYLDGMISRFLCSSTADGYNPYRVTRDGFDWETLNPDEPWSNIGYWGDHQIVYLLKLLEAYQDRQPEKLKSLLGEERYVYADVPYRIRGFDAIWENPRETVDYADEAAETSMKRSASIGADGKTLRDSSGKAVEANLIEKLMVPLLSKLSNFVPDGGIWMNAQRPEWNDANNALVGYGVSVVTLCYTYRYLEFLDQLLASVENGESVELDERLSEFLDSQRGIFSRFEPQLSEGFDEAKRYRMLSELGYSGERFREALYGGDFGRSKRSVDVGAIRGYLEIALLFVGKSIDSNRRSDGMYHSYNLLRPLGGVAVGIDRLPEMLEGQVAVLSSNRLGVEEVAGLLNSLRSSRLYRQDVESYTLYPDRDLPRFLEKNRVSAQRVEAILALRSMIERGDSRVLSKDVSGTYRFNGDFRNSDDVAKVLERIRGDYANVLDHDSKEAILSLFEDTFNHRSFTGRSGTFFAYEGLGSVYWHMVSKLILAIQENCIRYKDTDEFPGLASHYFETVDGLGLEKSPEEYGAFPIDAYSHTPQHAGAQQPGMTGQVKEDILSRFGELGVSVCDGVLQFEPILLKGGEFDSKPKTFSFIAIDGSESNLSLEGNSLAFTYCQTPVRYTLGDQSELEIEFEDGRSVSRAELRLTREESLSVFARSGRIVGISVTLCREQLLKD